jgi:hypothetical protein
LRGGIYFLAVDGQERLVRRHHVFPVLDGFKDELAGRFVTADEFHHDVDVGISDEPFRIVRKLHIAELDAPIALDVQVGDLPQFHRNAQPALDDVRVLDKDARSSRAHGPETDDTDVD